MSSTSFTMFTDPGHGWLAVTLGDIHNVGLKITDFTRYSYVRGDTLYLEEDCDAGKFMEAYKAKHGEYPILLDSHTDRDSLIRQQRRIGA